jgi:uncharacterized protein (TIGR03067 family)
MKRYAIVTVALVSLAALALFIGDRRSPAATQEPPVSGEWEVVVALRNGERYPDHAVANWIWKFDRNGNFTWEGNPPDLRDDLGPALYACDETTELKGIDFKHLTGPFTDRLTRGIYTLSGHELLINIPLTPDGERPGGFGAEWFHGNLTVTLRPNHR